MCVLVSLTGKVLYGWIRDLGFNLTYIKNRLVSWSDDKELSSETDVIDSNFLKKKKKKKKKIEKKKLEHDWYLQKFNIIYIYKRSSNP